MLLVGCAAAEQRTAVRGSTSLPRKVNLCDSFQKINEPWSPHVAGDVNECQLKLAKMAGSFVWHHHEHEDECFLVVKGKMRMKMLNAHDNTETSVDCGEGELIVVPRGVEHCPVALTDECHVLLVERGETLNTGSAADDLGDAHHEHGTVPLTKTTLNRLD